MRPDRGVDLAPPVAIAFAQLKGIRCAAAEDVAYVGNRLLNRPLGRGELMKPLRVLVVEDDLMIGPLLAETLEDLGHIVCAVEVSAAAAVAAALRYHPDLMIVDVGLGEESGIAAVKEILSRGFVPHVFVTGDLGRNLSLGPDAVLLQKPYRGSDIVAAIRSGGWRAGSRGRDRSGLAASERPAPLVRVRRSRGRGRDFVVIAVAARHACTGRPRNAGPRTPVA
jgi:CheY-like chemotaxis protein